MSDERETIPQLQDTPRMTDQFCLAVYHYEKDGSWTFCGGRRDDHPQVGHDYVWLDGFDPKCACGKIHTPPPEIFHA